MAGHTTNLLTGIAQRLADANVVRYSPTGTYPDGDDLPALIFNVMPTEPAAVVVLSGYSVSDDIVYGDSVTGVQVRFRSAPGDPRPTDDTADAVFDTLQGLHDVVIGGVPVQQVWRQSWAPLGQDQNRRHERSDNYYVQTLHAAPHRL